MTIKKNNGGCKLKTPYGDLIVNDKGEVYQNGKQLTQSDEMYDSHLLQGIHFFLLYETNMRRGNQHQTNPCFQGSIGNPCPYPILKMNKLDVLSCQNHLRIMYSLIMPLFLPAFLSYSTHYYDKIPSYM